MIAQEPGKLLELHMEPNIEAAETKDFWTYNNFYEDTFEPIMHEELTDYFLGNKESGRRSNLRLSCVPARFGAISIVL